MRWLRQLANARWNRRGQSLRHEALYGDRASDEVLQMRGEGSPADRAFAIIAQVFLARACEIVPEANTGPPRFAEIARDERGIFLVNKL